MTTPSKTAPLTNAQRQSRFYDKHAQRLARERAVERIKNGVMPRECKLDCYGLTLGDVNEIRATAGLAAVRLQERKRGAISANDGKVSLTDVMEAFNSLIGTGKRFKETTGNTYKANYREAIDWLGADHNNVIPALKDVEKVEKTLSETLRAKGRTQASLKDYLNALWTLCRFETTSGYCKALGDEVVKKYHDRMTYHRTKRVVEDIEKTKNYGSLTQAQIRQALRKAEEQFPNSQAHMIISLYNDFALRNDFGDVEIIHSDPPATHGNFYNPETNTLYLRKYKTDTTYGDRIYTPSIRTHQIIKEQMKGAGRNRKYLIGKGKYGLERYADPTYVGGLVGKAFKGAGVKATIRDIRHARVADVWGNSKSTAEDKIRLAAQMLHSVEVANLVYLRKYSGDEE